MARTSTYLNFPRATEAAFNFYNVFGTEFEADFARMCDVPAQDGMPPMAEEDRTSSCMWHSPFSGDTC